MGRSRGEIDRIKSGVDLVKVVEDTGIKLTPSGNRLVSLCPFHNDTNPSLVVDPDSQRWRCYGACNKGGDVIDFVQAFRNCSFQEALRELAALAGISLVAVTPEEQGRIAQQRETEEILTATVEFYHRSIPEPALKYLTETKGLTKETIEENQIGFALDKRDAGDKGLLAYLEALGHTREQAVAASVLYPDGREYFAGNIVFPNWFRGKVIYITGHGFPESTHKKPLADKLKSKHFFLEQPSRDKTGIITEGETDTYTVRQAGFPAWGIYGANGFDPELVEKLKHLDRVILALDGDAAGIKAAREIAEVIGEKARIVSFPASTCPDGKKIKDWNDLFTVAFAKDIARFRDEFSRLLDQAQTPLEFEINQIPPDTPARDIPRVLAPIIGKLATLSEVEQDFYVDAVVAHLKSAGISKQSLKRDIKQTQKTSGDASPDSIELLGDDYKRITPAQDFSGDTGYFTVPLDARVRGLARNIPLDKVTTIPYLVTSDREFERLNAISLLERKKLILASDPTFLDSSRWALGDIQRFLEGKETVDPLLVFHETRSVWEKYFEFKYGHIPYVLGLGTMGSYFYRIFEAFGYIAFVGEKGSGKSKTLLVADRLWFNSVLTCNTSASVFFRIIEGSSASVLIDEAEYFKDPKLFEDLRLMLNTGYKRGGRVLRSHTETFQPMSFDVYSPKMIANIKGLEDVLESRCIVFPMLKAKPGSEKADLDISERSEDWRYLRHQCYSFALTFFREIRDIYLNDPDLKKIPGLSGRSREIWVPLLSIAKFLDQKGCDGLFGEIRDVAQKMSANAQRSGVDNWTASILLGLRDITVEKEEGISNRDIEAALTPFLENEDEKPSPRFVGGILKRFDLIEEGGRTNRGYLYTIRNKAVRDVIERYSV